jgi:hypothetical protein
VVDAPTQLALRILLEQDSAIRDAAVPLRGKLAPDEKPGGLQTADQGLLFYSVDFDRAYRWSGAAWEDAPGQPARGMVAFFAIDPPIGWLRCDGRAGFGTTADGQVIRRVAPVVAVLNGLAAWVRL